ncbi:protein rolling stone-like [Acanthaster planci]|uniref:Protein rolling stone-like n=1 Tax=Acanthaster planci TaxID=133434 RepID=A0A8B7YTM2_ACAPL|nr:protein rolling stone-like [Acanthaster planci]XP_022096042.1 protein rolling stone-like [Acanthaster planci]XP_022096043.1 protein rolling stone-like [Acanthaster planci]XP_022096044.1 protein rolling stone-like [Acanthaster planci]
MASKCCKKMCHYLGFSGEPVQRFVLPQAKWPLAPVLWTLYRCFVAVYLTVWLGLILSVWGEPPFYRQADVKAKWLIYVSNWSFLVLTLYLITMAVGNVYYHATHGCKNTSVGADIDPESDPEGMIPMSSVHSPRGVPVSGDDGAEPLPPLPWYFKFAWFLQAVVYSSGLFVALNFYILVFDPATSTLHAYNFHIHGVNLIIIVLDLILAATPMRVLHLVYPSALAFVYFVFTLIYEGVGGLNEFGGTAIYVGFLDWGAAPVTSGIVMAIVVLVAAPVIHLIFYAFYRIRQAISKCCTGYCWTY